MTVTGSPNIRQSEDHSISMRKVKEENYAVLPDEGFHHLACRAGNGVYCFNIKLFGCDFPVTF